MHTNCYRNAFHCYSILQYNVLNAIDWMNSNNSAHKMRDYDTHNIQMGRERQSRGGDRIYTLHRVRTLMMSVSNEWSITTTLPSESTHTTSIVVRDFSEFRRISIEQLSTLKKAIKPSMPANTHHVLRAHHCDSLPWSCGHDSRAHSLKKG